MQRMAKVRVDIFSVVGYNFRGLGLDTAENKPSVVPRN